MLKIEDQCCDCAVPSYPCIGSRCPNRNVKVYYCDKCGEEIDIDAVYEVDDEHFCEECLKEKFLIDTEEE